MLGKLTQKSLTLSNAFRTRSLFARGLPSRNYGNMTQECADQLKSLGITNKNIVFNPS